MEGQTNRPQLEAEHINPTIINGYLFSEGMNYRRGELLPKRTIKTYELEFFLESQGGMYINDDWYEIKPGDIVFRRPYETTQAVMPYSCYALYFYIDNSLENKEYPIDVCECSGSSQIAFEKHFDNPIINALPRILHPIYPETYHRLFEGVLKDFIQPSEIHKLSTKSKILQILIEMYNETENPVSTLDSTTYGKLIKVTIDHIHRWIDKPILLSELAAMVNLSPNYYHVLFKNTMHITPHEYIVEARMKKAKELLVFTNHSVYEIAEQCGFLNAAYFSHYFKKKFSISPVNYRNKHRLES